jgi:hypothetical protein
MKGFMTVGFVLAFACQLVADERSAVARVTTYSRNDGSRKAAANGAKLNESHCAVDPKKVPYGSKIKFDDGSECTAMDTGPAVKKGKAAKASGRTAVQRNAIVVDRYFDNKQKAAAWRKTHPHFMKVRVQTADAEQGAH